MVITCHFSFFVEGKHRARLSSEREDTTNLLLNKTANATTMSTSTSTTTYCRPRYLYFSFFVWISTTGGRFLAPFLEHEGRLPTPIIGLVLGLQSIVSMLLSSVGGTWADDRERRMPGRGRVHVMALGVAGGGLCCLLHGLSHLFSSSSSPTLWDSPWWHGGLQLVYAACSVLTIPVLDGVTIQFLEEHPDFTKESYGHERWWGALAWVIIHMIMAPLLDWIGFGIIYPLALVSTVGTLATLYQYATLNGRSAALKRHSSDIGATESTDGSTSTTPPPPKVPLHVICRLLAGTCYGCAFLFALLTLAGGQAVVDNLVFIFFEYLGSSYTVMGLTVLLTISFEIPIFQAAPMLLERYGSDAMLLTAAACYVVRAIGYTFIPQGHIAYVLILEPLHGITYACGQTASVDMAAKCMPKGYESTGQSLMYLVRGLGSFLGLWLGGRAMDQWGPRLMYRASSSVVLLGSSVFAAALLVRRPSRTVVRATNEPLQESVETTRLL